MQEQAEAKIFRTDDDIKQNLDELNRYSAVVGKLSLTEESLNNLSAKKNEYENIIKNNQQILEQDPLLKAMSQLPQEAFRHIIDCTTLTKRLQEAVITEEEYKNLSLRLLSSLESTNSDKHIISSLKAAISEINRSPIPKETPKERVVMNRTFITHAKAISEKADLIDGKTKEEIITQVLNELGFTPKIEVETSAANMSKPYRRFLIEKNIQPNQQNIDGKKTITILASNSKDGQIVVFADQATTTCNIKDVGKNGGRIIKFDTIENIKQALYNIIYAKEIETKKQVKLEKEQRKRECLGKLEEDFGLRKEKIDPQDFLDYLVQVCSYNKNLPLYKEVLENYGDGINFEKIIPLQINTDTSSFYRNFRNENIYNASSLYNDDIKDLLVRGYKEKPQIIDKEKLFETEMPLAYFPLHILQISSGEENKQSSVEEICNLTLARTDNRIVNFIYKRNILNVFLDVAAEQGDTFPLNYIYDHSIGFNENIPEFGQHVSENILYSLLAIRDKTTEFKEEHVRKLYNFLLETSIDDLQSFIGQNIKGNFRKVFINFAEKVLNPHFPLSKDMEKQCLIMNANVNKFIRETRPNE